MCIIVAKNAGIAMPANDVLKNCFENNPDGAGFMLAAKNAVYGFKGLMSLEELTQELEKARKRFGNLDKLSVVLHFRISTHGSVVGGNTHPFPLKGGYREMRRLEWVADQGFAHNGIISLTSHDGDIKKHNVSDTMVFAKKFVNPIAKHCQIASDKDILDMLFDLAESKLCFLNRKGKIATRGEFQSRDGILYSNSSYEKRSYSLSNINGWYSSYYSYDYSNHGTSGSSNTSLSLSKQELMDYINELADENGLYPLPKGSVIFFRDNSVDNVAYSGEFYIDDCGWLYIFREDRLDFSIYATEDEYEEIVYPIEDSEEVDS